MLTPLHRLHLPLSPSPEPHLILLMHVAVLVAMHLVALRSAATRLSRTASLVLDLSPIGASLVIATATTTRSLARLSTDARRILHSSVGCFFLAGLAGRNGEVLSLGRPVTPPILVVAADAAAELFPHLQQERSLGEMGDIDGPRGKRARDNG